MPPLIHQADFVDRHNFGHFLNRWGLVGTAVEVGTHRGEFAYQLASAWLGNKLVCVDPWTNPPGYGPQAALLPGGGTDRNVDYAIAMKALAEFGKRIRFRRATSNKAVLGFAASSLDFVYIDGDHRYEFVLDDLNSWWPKLRPGGILAGHDFISKQPYAAYENVQRAVVNFAQRTKLDVYVVPELSCEPEFQPWSFYVIKPTK